MRSLEALAARARGSRGLVSRTLPPLSIRRLMPLTPPTIDSRMIKSSARSSTDLDPRAHPAGRRHGGWFPHHRDQRRGRPHHPLRRRLLQERRPPRRPGTRETCLVAFLSIDASRRNVERLLFSTYGHLVSRNNWPDEKKTRRFGSARRAPRRRSRLNGTSPSRHHHATSLTLNPRPRCEPNRTEPEHSHHRSPSARAW